MKIRVLGCHGSDQLLEADRNGRQCRTCGFLVNETVMVDAGTVGAALRLDEQKKIQQILLSHLHFDHVSGLPTLADNLVDEVTDPVVLTSIPEVLDGLKGSGHHFHRYLDQRRRVDADGLPQAGLQLLRTLRPNSPNPIGLRLT